ADRRLRARRASRRPAPRRAPEGVARARPSAARPVPALLAGERPAYRLRVGRLRSGRERLLLRAAAARARPAWGRLLGAAGAHRGGPNDRPLGGALHRPRPRSRARLGAPARHLAQWALLRGLGPGGRRPLPLLAVRAGDLLRGPPRRPGRLLGAVGGQAVAPGAARVSARSVALHPLAPVHRRGGGGTLAAALGPDAARARLLHAEDASRGHVHRARALHPLLGARGRARVRGPGSRRLDPADGARRRQLPGDHRLLAGARVRPRPSLPVSAGRTAAEGPAARAGTVALAHGPSRPLPDRPVWVMG